MNSTYAFGILIFVSIFFVGCLSQTQTQHMCEDGRTIVSNPSECPKIDTEYEECTKASAQAGYSYESPRDMCFYNLALTRENVSLCRKILNADSYGDYTAAKCGASLAILKDDPKTCEDLGLAYKYDCYSELVTETEDPSYCEKITLAQKKDDCLYDYVVYQGDYIRDWSICTKFSSDSSEADYCYYSAALNKKDTSYCDKITGNDGWYDYSKGDCYGDIGVETDNVAICERLTITAEKNDCYYSYATTYPYNVTICDKITNDYSKRDCVYYANDTY